MQIKKEDGMADKKSICAQAALLGEMLAESVEYRQYQEAKRKLQGDREQAYILSQLRRQQMSLRLAQIMGEEMEEAEDNFEHLYAMYCLEPVISDFLYAEGRLGRLISEVQQIYGDKLELWSENDAASHVMDQELN